MIRRFVILDEAEKTQAESLDNDEFRVQGRLMDAEDPGMGQNINPIAEDYGLNDLVDLSGKYVISYAVVNDPEYMEAVPALRTFLLTLPHAMLDTDTIFAPPEDE